MSFLVRELRGYELEFDLGRGWMYGKPQVVSFRILPFDSQFPRTRWGTSVPSIAYLLWRCQIVSVCFQTFPALVEINIQFSKSEVVQVTSR